MSIEVRDAGIRFGGVTALQGVSVEVERGDILSVIGPNGSGKSTLFNCISGMVQPDAGTVMIDGVDVTRLPPHRRIARGLTRTFQTPRFDPNITVAQAVLCGFYPVARAGALRAMFAAPSALREEREMWDGCQRILEDLGLDALRGVRMGELPMGQVRLVEVGRALANQPRYILLDEPAAGLTQTEQAVLTAQIRRLAATGVGILLVEHNFGLVRQLSDRVLVLNRGEPLVAGTPEELATNPTFIEVYLGDSGRMTEEAK